MIVYNWYEMCFFLNFILVIFLILKAAKGNNEEALRLFAEQVKFEFSAQ